MLSEHFLNALKLFSWLCKCKWNIQFDNFVKHYENITFEYPLNFLKQVKLLKKHQTDIEVNCYRKKKFHEQNKV